MMDDNDVFAGLEGVFDDVDESEFEDLTLVPTMELLERFEAATEALKGDLKQAWVVTSQDGRDAHSNRYALQLELRNRGVPV